MLRNPIIDDFKGRGYVPPLDPPMSCLLFVGWHEVITFAHCDRVRKHVIDLGNSLWGVHVMQEASVHCHKIEMEIHFFITT